MTTEEMVEELRNRMSGFGCNVVNDNDGMVDLYCETDEGKRMIVRFTGSAITIHREGVNVELWRLTGWNAEDMLAAAETYGCPMDYDSISSKEDPEGYADEIDEYEEETERRLGMR